MTSLLFLLATSGRERGEAGKEGRAGSERSCDCSSVGWEKATRRTPVQRCAFALPSGKWFARTTSCEQWCLDFHSHGSDADVRYCPCASCMCAWFCACAH